MYLAGFMGINTVVQRVDLRIPEGYALPATVMGKAGAFLLIPQKLDGAELFIGSQRRFAELDAAGWEALRKDQQKLHDMLQEDNFRRPTGQTWCSQPWRRRQSTAWVSGPSTALFELLMFSSLYIYGLYCIFSYFSY